MSLRFTPTDLAGVILIEPQVFRDDRGFFLETFRADKYGEAGIPTTFVQDNHSSSVKGTLRGLHLQWRRPQGKLVRVIRGEIWDVAVDIRRDSPTFGQWEAYELDDEANRQLFVPVGFAHGFCAISDLADVCYKVSAPYDAALERGVRWDDPRIGISWPTSHPRLSDRDRNNPRLEEAIA